MFIYVIFPWYWVRYIALCHTTPITTRLELNQVCSPYKSRPALEAHSTIRLFMVTPPHTAVSSDP